MIYLGIDPGVATTGWGVVEDSKGSLNGLSAVDHGVISTEVGQPVSSRLSEIYKGLRKILRKYKPAGVAIEQLFFCKNVKTAIRVGEARGVILLALSVPGLEIQEFTPLQVKDAVCGYGKADKKQVQRMVQSILGMDDLPRPDDAADGLALAICLASSMESLGKLANK